jgi:EAL and modified HD-GYP domain-containing signal transduction protein
MQNRTDSSGAGPGRILLLARQPIFDAALNVFAYELLHRSIDPDRATALDGSAASSQLLLDAFGPTGITDISEGKPVFINFTEHLVLHPPSPVPPQLVVEVLEDVPATPGVIAGLRALRERGFRIALDDFRHHAALAPMLEVADFVKLDVLAMSEPELRTEVRKLRNYPVRLLAEKIESWEMHNHCVDLGFSYFQGFFLAHPQTFHGERPGVDETAILGAIGALLRAQDHAPALASAITCDPMTRLRLLNLANGPDGDTQAVLHTPEEVIARLGPRTAGRACIAILAGITHKPRELLRLALARSRFCEQLGLLCGPVLAARAFETGTLSLLDAFLDRPLPELLHVLNASATPVGALLHLEGDTGALLSAATAFETATWDAVPWERLAAIGITKADAESAYLESLHWVSGALQALEPG